MVNEERKKTPPPPSQFTLLEMSPADERLLKSRTSTIAFLKSARLARLSPSKNDGLCVLIMVCITWLE